jgi:hypothetical protein
VIEGPLFIRKWSWANDQKIAVSMGYASSSALIISRDWEA